MKIIADKFFSVLVEDIISEKREYCDTNHLQFKGISSKELNDEIEKRLGKEWAIDDSTRHLLKSDVNAIANARFFRQTGQRMLMIMAIVVLGLAVVARFIPMTALYANIYYTIVGLVALGFIWIYSKKQAKVRKELRWKMGVRDTDEEK
jgi:uncharacterized membrane protein YuzA (DUF378 family)